MNPQHINISISKQELQLIKQQKVSFSAQISTAANGAGEQHGSGCTPRGEHIIRLKIGAGCPPNAVFVARRPTGEIYTPELAAKFPQRDWILSRILWLGGQQSGYNRGTQVDTLRRFIYIHGCPDDTPMGEPNSHGCVRMRNDDLIELFEQVDNAMPVFIYD